MNTETTSLFVHAGVGPARACFTGCWSPASPAPGSPPTASTGDSRTCGSATAWPARSACASSGGWWARSTRASPASASRAPPSLPALAARPHGRSTTSATTRPAGWYRRPARIDRAHRGERRRDATLQRARRRLAGGTARVRGRCLADPGRRAPRRRGGGQLLCTRRTSSARDDHRPQATAPERTPEPHAHPAVEDDALLGDGLRAGLRQLGFNVDWVRDGPAERRLRAASHDAAVLDLGLPMKGRYEVLAAARAGASTLPVLVLTARDALSERIRGPSISACRRLCRSKPVICRSWRPGCALVRAAHGMPSSSTRSTA